MGSRLESAVVRVKLILRDNALSGKGIAVQDGDGSAVHARRLHESLHVIES
ncbi:hypothetical protein D3C87_1065940 [compost metagenome]